MKYSHLVLTGGILLGLGLIGLFFTRSDAQKPADAIQISAPNGYAPYIRRVSGTVFVKRGKILFQATSTLALQSGDVIENGPNGKTDVIWPEYGHALIGPSSILEISDTRKDSSRLLVDLKVHTGRVWTRLQKTLGADSHYTIQASNVIATVRGTSFGVSLTPALVNIAVLESTVGVSRIEGRDMERQINVGRTIDLPIGDASGTSAIPAARGMRPQEMQDPFVMEGGREIPAEELHSTNIAQTADALFMVPPATVRVIEYQGRQIPVEQLQTMHGHAEGCAVEHFHAMNTSVLAIDETIMEDAGNCGFGTVSETPIVVYEVRQ